MRGVQANDPWAFGELYDRHSARAWHVARAVCHDESRAEDAVQEGFLAVWRNHGRYRSELGSVQGWLMTIIRNRAIDAVRRESATHRPRLADRESYIEDAAAGSTSDDVIARSEADALRDRLAHLPHAQAQVIALSYYGELSHSEIAARLSLPQGTVKGRMRLGMQKLRAQFGIAGGLGA
jgi:RNA polymerase sigma-70 factor (ECF subfamily)